MNLKSCTTWLVKHPVAAALLIFAVVAFSNLWGLGDGPMAKTEGVRVLTGHQMRESGQWLIPHLYGAVYLTKPPMYYWVIGLMEIITGHENEWVWRLPSALGTALLAVFLWGMSRRWFGATAGLVTGLSYIMLLTLWTQNRSAEIDALNNAASVVCACAILELGIGKRTRARWLWGGLVALSLASALLMKGPAGLPVVLGALVGVGVARKRGAALKSLPLWSGLTAGLALFAGWAVLVWRELSALNTGMDTSGLNEVAYRLDPANFLQDGLEIISLPLVLIAYAFPVSVAFIYLLLPGVRSHIGGDARVKAVTVATGATLGVCVLSLISNPRYGYMAPPMFCLCAGAVAMAWERNAMSARLMKAMVWLAGFTAVVITGLQVALGAAVCFRAPDGRFIIVVAGGLLLFALALVFRQLRQKAVDGAGLCLVMMCVLLSITFNVYMRVKRVDKSGYSTGMALRAQIGTNALVHAETMVRYHPEVFYYADVRVQRHEEMINERYIPASSGWYLLHPWEWEAWAPIVSNQLSSIMQLPGPDRPMLCRYEQP